MTLNPCWFARDCDALSDFGARFHHHPIGPEEVLAAMGVIPQKIGPFS